MSITPSVAVEQDVTRAITGPVDRNEGSAHFDRALKAADREIEDRATDKTDEDHRRADDHTADETRAATETPDQESNDSSDEESDENPDRATRATDADDPVEAEVDGEAPQEIATTTVALPATDAAPVDRPTRPVPVAHGGARLAPRRDAGPGGATDAVFARPSGHGTLEVTKGAAGAFDAEALLASSTVKPVVDGTTTGQAALAADQPALQAQDAATPTADPAADAKPRSPIARTGSTARFVDPRTLQVVESARASVFRQIAIKITGEGGEMRVQLDPPELGVINLRMVVESGGLRLHIIAERPELTQVLERHLGELRDVLTQQGLDVSHTSVESGDAARREFERGENDSTSRDDFDGDDEDQPVPERPRGYITSEGLDFFV